MKVILQADIQGVGKVGEVIEVKEGFARNHLFPRNLAQKASVKSIREKKHMELVKQARLKKVKKERQKILDEITQAQVEFAVQAAKEGKLFGSVTASDIAKKLQEKGWPIGKQDVVMPKPIKEVGEHSVEIRLGDDQKTELKVLLNKS